MKNTEFSKNIKHWYSINKRELPWRNTNNPYHIWLSEIILQQTRVIQGLPYFLKFTEAFPTINDLAQADIQEVLRLWQGLGYYSRARNLHTTAKHISEKLSGEFPNSYLELLKLKGVGKYTAAAIASFAFNENVAVLDGNVYRVLARHFGIDTDIASPLGEKEFSKLANELLPDLHCHIYNQGIMEFGALHCTPVNPNCDTCTLSNSCIAFKNNLQKALPVKIKKIKIKERFLNYLIIQFEDKYYLKERNPKDIWQGLNEFYLIEDNRILSTEELIAQFTNKESINNQTFNILSTSKIYKHILTHQRLNVQFTHIKTTQNIDIQEYTIFTLDEIENLGKPIIIANFIKEYFK